jgi:dipeptidyl aminopeptidase/acylaminoacyl peptidase
MNRDDEQAIRRWLEARDPGLARGELREAVRAVPFSERPARFPALGLTLRAGFGIGPIARPLLLLVVVLATLVALAGAVVLQPWRPFPPRGLLAYTAPIAAHGSTGISLAAADGSGGRQVSPMQANLYDHSPRWSRDGRTLLLARTTALDPLGSCGGVGSVVLYDVASRTERVVATSLRPINVIDWSPSGDKAAYTYPPPGCGAQVELGVVDLRTGQVTTTVVVPQVSELDPSPVLWHVGWVGDQASAVPDSVLSSTNGRDFTTTIDVPSHAGSFTIQYQATSPARIPTLMARSGATGASVDLGAGGVPAWSPDDSAVAYIQPGGPAGPNAVEFMRDHLVIASVGTWQTRVVAEVLVISGPPADIIPVPSWTPDGAALYWTDPNGVHVIDVATGRSAELAGIPIGCTDLEWQPATS